MSHDEPQQSRAQRFESEKQRISESCFSKVDEQGQGKQFVLDLHYYKY